MDNWNPRYVAYAKAHHKSPAEMLAHDEYEWPGGCMAGFMDWLGEQWDTFEDAHATGKISVYERSAWRLMNADAFDVWLNK